MEISKEYLEDKLKQWTSQKNKVTDQVNEGIRTINRLEGAIDAIAILLKDIDKIEDNKE